MVVLISDLLTDVDSTLKGLQLLRQRGHDVMVLHIMDDDELDFPFSGPTRFEGLELPEALDLQPSRLARGLPRGVTGVLAPLATSLRGRCHRLRTDPHQRPPRCRLGQVPDASVRQAKELTAVQFLYQPLTWGFFLVLLPLLIHLINLMRQRRVEWAAMEFLLAAYRKQRKWIWLRQFLLLASRMLAIALAVAMLAHLVTRDQLSFFGGRTTHHIVLLDDSYSMSDRVGSRSAFDRAEQVLSRLADRAMAQDSRQRFTLLRYSQAGATGDGDPTRTVPDGRSGRSLRRIRGFECRQRGR